MVRKEAGTLIASANYQDTYRVQEFAGLAKVTVRALHHYDRLGLLKPKRAQSGYRVYCVRDLERLEQIVALKFLGLPLRQIKIVLDRGQLTLGETLRLQRRVLERKRKHLDDAIIAIQEAETAVRNGKGPDAALLAKVIEVIEMQQSNDWMMKYYDEAAKQKVEERRSLWSPELQERVSRQWSELMAEVEAAKQESPSGELAKRLATRWKELIEEFTGGDAGITTGLKSLYADKNNWPDGFQQQKQAFQMSPEAWTFIHQAVAELKQQQA